MVDTRSILKGGTAYGQSPIDYRLDEFDHQMYFDNTVEPSTTYCYRVCAVDAGGGKGPFSREVQATTKAPDPLAILAKGITAQSVYAPQYGVEQAIDGSTDPNLAWISKPYGGGTKESPQRRLVGLPVSRRKKARLGGRENHRRPPRRDSAAKESPGAGTPSGPLEDRGAGNGGQSEGSSGQVAAAGRDRRDPRFGPHSRPARRRHRPHLRTAVLATGRARGRSSGCVWPVVQRSMQSWSAVACHRFGRAEQAVGTSHPFSQGTVFGQGQSGGKPPHSKIAFRQAGMFALVPMAVPANKCFDYIP